MIAPTTGFKNSGKHITQYFQKFLIEACFGGKLLEKYDR